MNHFLSGILAVAVCVAAGSCARTGTAAGESDKPVVLASIPPLAAIADAIGGDRITTLTVCKADTDPETFEPTAAGRLRMGKADAYFMAGYLPFEHSLAESLQADNPAIRAVDTSRSLELVTGTHSENCDHDHSHDVDPHTWSSLRNGAEIARTVCAAICDIDPDGADIYRANLDSLLGRISMADSTIRANLDNAPSRAFIVWHPSLSYFARDYGLRQIALGVEGKDPTPARMKAAIDKASADDARVMFVQGQYDNRGAASVNDHINARLVAINPLDSCWIEQLISISDEISRP